LPPVEPLPIQHLPTGFATISSPPIPVILSPSACFSNDHYAGTSSPPIKVHASKSVTVEKTGFAAGSPMFVVRSSPSIRSPADLQLCINLSLYPL